MPSFDIISEIDFQEVDNAVNQTAKEISQRFDFRGTESKIEFERNNSTINVFANSEGKIDNILTVLHTKAVKRQIDLKAFKPGKTIAMTGFMHKNVVQLMQGIEKETAKKIVKFIKEKKLKVQASIHDDKVRVTGKKRDDLQEVMSLIKVEDFELPLQFDNYRD